MIAAMARLAAVVICVLLASCAAEKPSGPPEVAWGVDVAESVKADLEAKAAAKDCDGLQAAFDTAETHKNADLMAYIDWTMDNRANCY